MVFDANEKIIVYDLELREQKLVSFKEAYDMDNIMVTVSPLRSDRCKVERFPVKKVSMYQVRTVDDRIFTAKKGTQLDVLDLNGSGNIETVLIEDLDKLTHMIPIRDGKVYTAIRKVVPMPYIYNWVYNIVGPDKFLLANEIIVNGVKNDR